MTPRYRIPRGIELVSFDPRPILSTPQGGRVALDVVLLSVWRQADGCKLDDILADLQAKHFDATTVRAAVACLAEAGLLQREGEKPEPRSLVSAEGDRVSVVIVSYNSREWLDGCLSSLLAQSYSSLEIMLVDNCSQDDSADWVAANYPQVRLLRLEKPSSLAHALNRGVEAATGAYFLLLNPDVQLESDAVAQMITVAKRDPSCAAVAAKLKYLWAPSFLNGLGNYVGAFSWGTDYALGHLDLGQFDSMRQVPSACFAATLIPRSVWVKVGAIDEGFPLYYEDSEWCYRARVSGYSICAAPGAIVYHAFGGRIRSSTESGLVPRKLRNVVYGRLRFAIKILSPTFLRHFLFKYLTEDAVGLLAALARLKWDTARAYWDAWRDVRDVLPALARVRRDLQSRRVCSDEKVFSHQKQVPIGFVWNGLPELTWDLVQSHYLPLLLSNKPRTLPEFLGVSHLPIRRMDGMVLRAFRIWRREGFRMLVRRIAKYTRWFLARV